MVELGVRQREDPGDFQAAEERINSKLQLLRSELKAMHEQDVTLLRTLMNIHFTISALGGGRGDNGWQRYDSSSSLYTPSGAATPVSSGAQSPMMAYNKRPGGCSLTAPSAFPLQRMFSAPNSRAGSYPKQYPGSSASSICEDEDDEPMFGWSYNSTASDCGPLAFSLDMDHLESHLSSVLSPVPDAFRRLRNLPANQTTDTDPENSTATQSSSLAIMVRKPDQKAGFRVEHITADEIGSLVLPVSGNRGSVGHTDFLSFVVDNTIIHDSDQDDDDVILEDTEPNGDSSKKKTVPDSVSPVPAPSEVSEVKPVVMETSTVSFTVNSHDNDEEETIHLHPPMFPVPVSSLAAHAQSNGDTLSMATKSHVINHNAVAYKVAETNHSAKKSNDEGDGAIPHVRDLVKKLQRKASQPELPTPAKKLPQPLKSQSQPQLQYKAQPQPQSKPQPQPQYQPQPQPQYQPQPQPQYQPQPQPQSQPKTNIVSHEVMSANNGTNSTEKISITSSKTLPRKSNIQQTHVRKISLPSNMYSEPTPPKTMFSNHINIMHEKNEPIVEPVKAAAPHVNNSGYQVPKWTAPRPFVKPSNLDIEPDTTQRQDNNDDDVTPKPSLRNRRMNEPYPNELTLSPSPPPQVHRRSFSGNVGKLLSMFQSTDSSGSSSISPLRKRLSSSDRSCSIQDLCSASSTRSSNETPEIQELRHRLGGALSQSISNLASGASLSPLGPQSPAHKVSESHFVVGLDSKVTPAISPMATTNTTDSSDHKRPVFVSNLAGDNPIARKNRSMMLVSDKSPTSKVSSQIETYFPNSTPKPFQSHKQYDATFPKDIETPPRHLTSSPKHIESDSKQFESTTRPHQFPRQGTPLRVTVSTPSRGISQYEIPLKTTMSSSSQKPEVTPSYTVTSSSSSGQSIKPLFQTVAGTREITLTPTGRGNVQVLGTGRGRQGAGGGASGNGYETNEISVDLNQNQRRDGAKKTIQLDDKTQTSSIQLFF